MTLDECYKVLDISPGCPEKDIKTAFHKKAFELHPDRNNGKDEEFKKVNEAYSILSGKQKPQPQQQEQGFGFNPFSNIDFGGFNIHDFINLNDLGAFGRKRSNPRAPENDMDIRAQIDTSVYEIKQGRVFKFEYQKSKPCGACNGVGGKEKHQCQSCGGAGMITKNHRQGNTIFSECSPCLDCMGKGQKIADPCKECNGDGFINYIDSVVFEIKERK